MFKVESIHIDGFWGEYQASSDFRADVNIIIGKNGTGKTTFMNIMHAVLSVDVEGLFENYFKSVSITLSDGKRQRKINANRMEFESTPFPIIEYKISNKKFAIPLFGIDESRSFAPSMRRRAAEDAAQIKAELSKMVSLASLSVYRLGGDIDPEIRDRNQRRHLSPVDQRLGNLTQRLTQYQLELSNEARTISSDLQRDVLTSLLYTKTDPQAAGYPLKFGANLEKQKLLSAYSQLGVSGVAITRKIQEHIIAIAKAAENLRKYTASKDGKIRASDIDFGALDAFERTQRVVQLSLDSETKINKLFSQITLFINTLQQFIPDKEFKFESGALIVHGKETIALAKLSSGEKQLLILFIEALLQRRKPFIFLADEPELSLHISWQRNIVSAIKSINPEAQIIVATHSPEIAGKFRNEILDMENIRHV
ncbi:MAG: ATP-binding protein [Candidatus Saccharibacteria bacterium]|nr:ATP-binding protein [Moraxellaceae bacterium]